jgi:hypothetical protein
MVTREVIQSRRFSDPRWLRTRGVPLRRRMLKLTRSAWAARMLDAITTTRATWNGHNSSGWKEDLLRVNGFDERMGYGGLDRELGERLLNMGLRARQVRNRAVCLHLDHERPWRTGASLDQNLSIRRHTRSRKVIWTEHGIRKGGDGPGP